MRYYNSKNVERVYVVVQHQLRGINTEILGVRYRDGYAVVAKDSKEYINLRQIRLAIKEEYPLTILKTLKCITNDSQVKVIWGQHVYKAYKEALMKSPVTKLTPTVAIEAEPVYQCEQFTKAGTQCKNSAITRSCFCKTHIAFDKRIAAKLIEAGDIDKGLRTNLIDQWIKELE